MAIDQQLLTPTKVMQYLDKYVIGQHQAKRAVAVSLRNRWRRKNLPENLRNQITPKNLLIQGPTGSGKTEIARRLAKLTQAPFLRVQATKYTEIGYVGKDVNSIIEDLAKVGINNYKERYDKFLKSCQQKILEEVYKQILFALVNSDLDKEIEQEKLKNLKNGLYDDRTITIMPGWVSNNLIELGYELPFFPTRPITKTIKQAIPFLLQSHLSKLKNSFQHNFDPQKQAIKLVQQQGIVYLDEIDKLITPEGALAGGSKGVSTEGVQRDLLPILQGTYVSTKFGEVRTDHILFVASGSFSMTKVQDLMPELLGRLPVRVSLNPISLQDFYRILTEPENNILSQQINLLKTEEVQLKFEQDAIRKIAEIAFDLNQSTQNLGARRLHSLVEKILQDISFVAPEKKGQKISITKQYVLEKLEKMKSKINLSKYLI